ncbi:MAG: helix-turn-helix transcriptional regulator, partial [Blastocatellia bacterium]|nr:helix-turn-helix transcriptional regulator [Blastocatellia bacterium]
MAQKKITHEQIVGIVADKLRDARKQRGMSQQDLAHAAHMPVTYLGKLERAESAPTIDMLARISKALGIDT